MKTHRTLLRLALAALAPVLSQCASTARKDTSSTVVTAPAPASAKDAPASAGDDLDEYAVVEIADPLEGLNRGTFWLNDKLYLVLFRPISKGYETVLPKPVRRGVDNAFVNARFPVRLVNSALQGKFRRAGQETEKFLLNTVVGLGGLFKVSDKFDRLTDIPAEDTGKTFANWGMGHGAYLVIPIVGASSIRDGIGLAADNALNPVNWGAFWGGNHDWTMIPPSVDSLRLLPGQLDTYDKAREDAVDPYIAVRSAWVQFRAEAVKK